jgi:TolB-like protein/DNA-binding winged helix-turn-helix (wHTH) protein
LLVAASSAFSSLVRFGDYELDLRTGELCRNGTSLKLQPQPAKILIMLVSRAGDVVSRQELTRQVWGSGTFVDFEQGLNFAIRQIRAALEDDPENPRFIETLPKRGYRFAAPVTDKPAATVAPAVAQSPSAPSPSPTLRKTIPRYVLALGITAAAAVALMVAAGWGNLLQPKAKVSASGITSLAVLPLHNLSRDPEQEYFSDGMTDELITDLAKVSRLRVISRTSVERYKGTKRSLPDIARELGVDAVVEGTVMRSGDRVRITAQLIDARSDRHLWADSYERDARDVFALQSEVAKQIVSEIGFSLSSGEQSRLAAAGRTVDPAAHEAYLKGIFYFDRMKCSTFDLALAYFREAVDKDPSFAPAYSGLADTYFQLADWRCWQTAPLDKAEASALKAIELDPESAGAHAVLGEIAFSRDWNWTKAAEEFSTAVFLDPNDAGIHSSYGIYLVAMGKTEQGLAEVLKAQQLAPLSEKANMTQTWALYLAHRYDQAIANATRALIISPSYGENYWLGQCYEKKGMPEQAMDFNLKAFAGLPREIPLRRTAYQKHGLPGYWQEDERLRRQRNERIDAVFQANYYAHMGKNENAIEQLQLAYQQHGDGLQFLKVEPVYDSLRDDPRFQELLSRLRL